MTMIDSTRLLDRLRNLRGLGAPPKTVLNGILSIQTQGRALRDRWREGGPVSPAEVLMAGAVIGLAAAAFVLATNSNAFPKKP